MGKLISAVVGPYLGKPILVIGGGPSTAVNLKHIPLDYPAAVISANGHGFKQDRFNVDFIVGVDWYFGGTRQPMQEYVAQFKRPTINSWSWADYRIPEWTFNGDSGLTAIAVAVMLGGHPIVPLGMDRYVGTKRYFWQEVPEPGWDKRRTPNIDNVREHTRKCVEFAAHSQVRMFDGPMRAYWPVFNHPVEQLPEWRPCRAPQCSLLGKDYLVQKDIFLHPTDRVDAGKVVTLTDFEAKPHLRTQKIVRL